MSHEIEEFADGTAAFFSHAEPAWHKLGVVTTQALTADEALRLAQLDWQVTKQPLVTQTEMGDYPVPGWFATVRNHPQIGHPEVLGVVGSRYCVVQNAEAFAFADDLVAESGAHFETAGSLQGGRRVFMSMLLPDYMDFGGRERVDLYLLVITSHDGWMAFTAVITPMRVVCSNTLRVGLHQAQSMFRVRHTSTAQGRISEARRALNLTFAYRGAFEEEAKRLLDRQFTKAAFDTLCEQLVKVPQTSAQVTERMVKNAQDNLELLESMWNLPTQDGIRDTAWGALNAVAEYADWYAPVRSLDHETSRATRVVLGQADEIKSKAFALLTK